MRSITPTSALGLPNLLPQSWSLPLFQKQFDAVSKWWRSLNSATFVGLPPCPDALPVLNQNDTNKAKAQAQDKVDQTKGSQEYQKTYNKLSETPLG
jgi:hypothetical protein